VASRPAALGLILLLIVSSLLAAGLWGLYFVGSYNDDSMYLGLARGLAQGLGYRDAGDPDLAPHDRFPPGYPLLLVPVHGNLTGARLLSLGLSLAALGLAGAYLKNRLPARQALAAVALTGLNFLWAHSATTVMSDIPFACASLAFILAGEHLLAARRGTLPMVGLALLGALCTSLRIVGALLVPVTAVGAWRAGRRRELAVYLGATGLFQAPLLLGALTTGYGGQAAAGHRDVGANLLYYFKALPLTLWGDPFLLLPHLERPDFGAVLGWCAILATWAALLAGAPAWRRARPDLTLPWLAANLLLLAVWPYLTPRFLLHLLPLLYATLVRAAPLLVLPLLAAQLATDAQALRQPPVGPPAALHAWIESHTRAGEPVATERHAVWLYTGRPVLTLETGFAIEHEEFWLEQLLSHGVRAVAHFGTPDDALNDLLRRRPQLFHGAATGPEWQAWSFTPPPSLAAELARYREALQLRKAGQLAEAERLLQPLSLPGARLELALLALQQGQPERAERELRAWLVRDPRDLRALRLLEGMRGNAP